MVTVSKNIYFVILLGLFLLVYHTVKGLNIFVWPYLYVDMTYYKGLNIFVWPYLYIDMTYYKEKNTFYLILNLHLIRNI